MNLFPKEKVAPSGLRTKGACNGRVGTFPRRDGCGRVGTFLCGTLKAFLFRRVAVPTTPAPSRSAQEAGGKRGDGSPGECVGAPQARHARPGAPLTLFTIVTIRKTHANE